MGHQAHGLVVLRAIAVGRADALAVRRQRRTELQAGHGVAV